MFGCIITLIENWRWFYIVYSIFMVEIIYGKLIDKSKWYKFSYLDIYREFIWKNW